LSFQFHAVQANGIERICTFNRGDFEAVSGIFVTEHEYQDNHARPHGLVAV
jgi:hypothetical protein